MFDRTGITEILHQAVDVLRTEGLLPESRCVYAASLFAAAEIRIPAERSACILHLPEVRDGRMIPDRVTVQLQQFGDPCFDLYLALHEVSHLLSVAPLVPAGGGRYIRSWGICSTEYEPGTDGFTAKVNRDCERQNEQMTDCLACYLYEALEHQALGEDYLRKRGPYGALDQRGVIRAYLSNGAYPVPEPDGNGA